MVCDWSYKNVAAEINLSLGGNENLCVKYSGILSTEENWEKKAEFIRCRDSPSEF
jgi:hypothetical protein